MSIETDILTELKRIGGLLQECNKINADWIVEMRQRQAENDADHEAWKAEVRERNALEDAWKEELKRQSAENARIYQERTEMEQKANHALVELQERWRKEDVERINRLDRKNDRLIAASILARAELERKQEEEHHAQGLD